MATSIVYSPKPDMAYELISAVHAIGNKVTAIAINDEDLAINLAEHGVHVLALRGNNLALENTTGIAWVLKQVIDRTQASNVFLACNHHLQEVAKYLSKMIKGYYLTDVSNLRTKGQRLVCTCNSVYDSTIVDIEFNKQRAVIALSSGVFPAAPLSSGGSIEDIKIRFLPIVTMSETSFKQNSGLDIENMSMSILTAKNM